MLTIQLKYMRVLQSKFTKTNPTKFSNGGARPLRRSWIRLWGPPTSPGHPTSERGISLYLGQVVLYIILPPWKPVLLPTPEPLITIEGISPLPYCQFSIGHPMFPEKPFSRERIKNIWVCNIDACNLQRTFYLLINQVYRWEYMK